MTPHQFRVLAVESRQRLQALHGRGARADREHLHEMLQINGLHPTIRSRVQMALNRHVMRERMDAYEKAMQEATAQQATQSASGNAS